MNKCCKVPFSQVEIHKNGNVYVCCPAKVKCSIGNIYEKPFEEIWHSDIAKEFRKEILENNNYKYCDLKICNPLDNIEQDKLELIEEVQIDCSETPEYPLYVKFCHDNHCNLKCVTCRDNFITSSKERLEELDSYIHSVYLPILKNCKIVSLNGSGEVFASKHCINLVKAIAEEYPNIKFEFHTNGVLATEKMFKDLGIEERIVSINVSMHAYKKSTYEKIMLGSNYDLVLKNLEYFKSLKEKGTLKCLDLYFVVQKMNYKEMPEFIEFAKSIGANVYFWEYRNWGNNWGKENYKDVAIYEKSHILYNNFAKLLKNPIFKDKCCHFNHFLETIKPISLFEHIKIVLKERFSNDR